MAIQYSKMLAVSKEHSNRRAYNWLAYQNFDHFLVKFIPMYRGILYDLGAGEAHYKNFFLQYASEYVAVDWGGSSHSTKSYVNADLNKPLPIESGVADTVVSISVIEHLCEPQTMLNEAFRILKPGGAMILQVPWQWRIHEEPYDFFRYTPYGLKHLLSKAGFVDVVVEAQSGFFTMWLLKFNYASRGLIRGPKPLRWMIQLALIPVWYINQKVAPHLDKLNKNWALETAGYFVTTRKP
ncbi:MAG: SAM-dependent methyltransferase [Halioglobus sp.]|jgi:SAM-dependent methyltransferase